MGIEDWNHNHQDHNPAWKAVENLRKWCLKIDLHPNTVKPFFSLNQVLERTALGSLPPVKLTDFAYLTPIEKKLIEGNPYQFAETTKLAIFDIDGVLVDFWSTLTDFWHQGKYNIPTLRETIEKDKPSWTCLLPLGEVSRRVDKVILWTSRFTPTQVKPFFGNLGAFDAFPFLSQEKIKKIEENFFPGKIKVIAGKIKGLSKSGFAQVTELIEELEDPYIVYVGSSLFDIHRFKNLINYLRQRELPFDRFVFLTNGHLIF